MASLRKKQSKFTHMVALLILHFEQLGYEVTISWWYRNEDCNKLVGGHPKSNHLNKLAVDINLFLDGKYITNGIGHKEGHIYWKSIGGATGIPSDMNHYSLKHNGIR